MTNQTRKPSCR